MVHYEHLNGTYEHLSGALQAFEWYITNIWVVDHEYLSGALRVS